MLSDLIQELSMTWESYWTKKITNKDHRVHKIVLNEIPNLLDEWTQGSTKYIHKGSDGQGNILRTPWVASFNREVTTSATKGFYPVYLFREDMKEMVLEIGFGTTQFEEKYGRGKTFFDEMTSAVVSMQNSSQHLLRLIDPQVRNRISLSPTKLDYSQDFKLRAYEKCSIYSIKYSIQDLPTEQKLRSDYLEILKLYDAMVESLLLPSEEEFVLENIQTPEVPDDFSPTMFEPQKKKKRKKSSKSKSSIPKRFSKSADKVGKIGEEFVFEAERAKLRKMGLHDLAEKVIWHRNYAENRFPGWDITSYEKDGAEKYIEVKTSTGKKLSSIILTSNEWDKANSFIGTPRYQIYLVTKVLSKPEVQILIDPAAWVKKGTLDLQIETYVMDLSEETESD